MHYHHLPEDLSFNKPGYGGVHHPAPRPLPGYIHAARRYCAAGQGDHDHEPVTAAYRVSICSLAA